ncbi:unnamed protein product [Arctogadus glacialis]
MGTASVGTTVPTRVDLPIPRWATSYLISDTQTDGSGLQSAGSRAGVGENSVESGHPPFLSGGECWMAGPARVSAGIIRALDGTSCHRQQEERGGQWGHGEGAQEVRTRDAESRGPATDKRWKGGGTGGQG